MRLLLILLDFLRFIWEYFANGRQCEVHLMSLVLGRGEKSFTGAVEPVHHAVGAVVLVESKIFEHKITDGELDSSHQLNLN